VTRGGTEDTRRLQPFPFFRPSDDIVREVAEVPLSACLFDRTVLDPWLLRDPRLSSLEGSYLLLSLLEKATPCPTYRATVIRYQSESEAQSAAQPERDARFRDDVARLYQRFVGRAFSPPPRLVPYEALRQAVQRVPPKRLPENCQVRHEDGVIEYLLPPAFAYSVGPEEGWATLPLQVSLDDLERAGQTAPLHPDALFPLVVEPPVKPWAYGLAWPIRFSDDRPRVLRLHCRVERGTAAFGVATWQRQSFEYRVVVPRQDGQVVVNLPIPYPSEAGPIVVQATHGDAAVRVVIDAAQLFATEARLPLAATKHFLQENADLKSRLDTAEQDREALAAELARSRRRTREMRESRLWQLGTLYWRSRRRLDDLRARAARRLGRPR
jgi:hypothetical protein